MRLVVLESPYAGDIRTNVAYARCCVADCLARGDAPIASHLLYTQPGILRDDVPVERALGIEAGLLWAAHAQVSVFYTDLGWSPGMEAALKRAYAEDREAVVRRLGEGWELDRATARRAYLEFPHAG